MLSYLIKDRLMTVFFFINSFTNELLSEFVVAMERLVSVLTYLPLNLILGSIIFNTPITFENESNRRTKKYRDQSKTQE